MEKLEILFRYLISPVVFVLLFATSLFVGIVFMIMGIISYLKLRIADKGTGFYPAKLKVRVASWFL
jgi:hypothetical protein